MKAQLQAVSIRIQTMSSTAAMAESMKGAAKAMYQMNRQVNLPAMQRIMMQFEKEGEMMDLKCVDRWRRSKRVIDTPLTDKR